MSEASLAELLERVVLVGVAITTRALSEANPGFDLTFPQWRVLVVLGDEPKGATVSAVAERIGVTLPATSRQLRRLARRGLVVVERDDRDRRAARARLTPIGQATRRVILDYRRRWIAGATAGISVAPAALDGVARAADVLERSL